MFIDVKKKEGTVRAVPSALAPQSSDGSVVVPVVPDILHVVVPGALPPVGANKNPWKIKRFQTFAFPKLLVPFFMYVTTLVTR